MNGKALSETHKTLLRHYIRAKDDNKPHIMRAVFADSAALEMQVNTESISFPSQTKGLDEITKVLVRDFSHSYENVYTFCLTDTFNTKDKALSCHWLVGMNERESGNLRVGCGRYDWQFNDDENPLTDSLKISIEQMLSFTPQHSEEIMKWLVKAPYPFSDSVNIFELMPNIKQLQKIRDYAKQYL